jgi:hypothetical protein
VLKLGAAFLALWLLGLGLSGCSLAGPSERSFTRAVAEDDDAPSPGGEAAAKKLEADRATCQTEARQKGIRSVLAIIKSADRRNTDKDYVDCMKKKGYTIDEGSGMSASKAAQGASQIPGPKQ